MVCSELRAVYFSPTGGTKKIVSALASDLANALPLPRDDYDFTLPATRSATPAFASDQLVLFALPVYAGRLPNVMLPWLKTLEGNGATAVAVVVYGNRNFDNALIELRDLLADAQFRVIAGGAFIAEHAFSTLLAAGRPDREDMGFVRRFGKEILAKLTQDDFSFPDVSGISNAGYYQPRDRAGNPVDIRKVTPRTDDKCINCKLCARVCPMGSISYEDVSLLTGICIKCCACEKKCPVGAKYFDDPAYLYHKEELELGYARRAEPRTFL